MCSSTGIFYCYCHFCHGFPPAFFFLFFLFSFLHLLILCDEEEGYSQIRGGEELASQWRGKGEEGVRFSSQTNWKQQQKKNIHTHKRNPHIQPHECYLQIPLNTRELVHLYFYRAETVWVCKCTFLDNHFNKCQKFNFAVRFFFFQIYLKFPKTPVEFLVKYSHF